MAVETTIENFVVGDDMEIERFVSGLDAAIDKAWLTVKRSATDTDARALFQKVITTTFQAGIGEIAADGDEDGEAQIRFFLTPADTLKLNGITAVFDIQIRFAGTLEINTPEKGTMGFQSQITQAAT